MLWLTISQQQVCDVPDYSGPTSSFAVQRSNGWARAIVTLLWILAAFASGAQAQDSDPMLLHQANGTTVRGHLQFGLNPVSERNLFWNFSETVAPGSGFDPDATWVELYVKPGLSVEKTLIGGPILYGKITAVASYTFEKDAYDFGNTERATLEEAFIGMRSQSTDSTRFDLSLGSRELKLGTGMLIANGGSSGFERGALKFGPRKAWEVAALGTLSGGGFTGTVYYIDPNERPAADGNNQLAGIDLRLDGSAGGFLGLTFVNVLKSTSPYIQAATGGTGAPTVIPGAREGTNALNVYGNTYRFAGALKNWGFSSDLAYEWNDRVELSAWAVRAKASYTYSSLPYSAMS